MEFMPWSEKYILGFDSIDNQHNKLVTLINNLYKNMIKVEGDFTTEKIIEELVDYTKYHFEHEEKMF